MHLATSLACYKVHGNSPYWPWNLQMCWFVSNYQFSQFWHWNGEILFNFIL